jgi:hypothetical protein
MSLELRSLQNLIGQRIRLASGVTPVLQVHPLA